MKKRMLTIGGIILFILLISLIFLKMKELKDNENASCEGLLITKCNYNVKFISNEHALELIEDHNGKLLRHNEVSNEFSVLLTKHNAKKLSNHPNVEYVWIIKSIKGITAEET